MSFRHAGWIPIGNPPQVPLGSDLYRIPSGDVPQVPLGSDLYQNGKGLYSTVRFTLYIRETCLPVHIIPEHNWQWFRTGSMPWVGGWVSEWTRSHVVVCWISRGWQATRHVLGSSIANRDRQLGYAMWSTNDSTRLVVCSTCSVLLYQMHLITFLGLWRRVSTVTIDSFRVRPNSRQGERKRWLRVVYPGLAIHFSKESASLYFQSTCTVLLWY